MGIEGKYAVQIQEALDRVNEIRKEACQEGVPNPSSKGKKLTMADYVPIQWSSGLEYIARIRAAEAVVLSEHERPNGKDCFSLKAPGGTSSYGEVLAWPGGDMLSGIYQWYSEKEDWVNQTPNAVTGHYTSMIKPSNRYMGLGTFVSAFGENWGGSVCGQFCSQDNSGPTALDGKEQCIQTVEVRKESLEELQIFQGYNDISDVLGLGVGKQTELTARVKVVFDEDISFCNYLDSITWTSSNPSVAQVDSMGVVTVNKAGNAVITASAENGMSASCRLVTAPKSTSLTSLKGGNRSITVRWKKQNQADGYVIRISEEKSLKSNFAAIILEGNKNTKQVFNNLEQKRNYYVRIQTYKKVGEEFIYSDWSKVKKVQTK